ncbi:MAG: Mannitol dehydrogenase domain protein [Acidimicrobiaceae bacterium]|nr:Mannitol dehydrogenase domain protein [Acidimicrobiaceae bacterium]
MPGPSGTQVTALNEASLVDLSDRMAIPGYQRSQVRPGIVHLGVGGFHRAHQAFYLDRLMNLGKAMDWGIVGVGVLARDRPMRDALLAQDELYCLVEKASADDWRARVIGSMIGYLLATDDPEAVIERLAHPTTRIVSLTITEAGYHVGLDGSFDVSAPEIAHDLERRAAPATVFGLVVEAVRRRRQRGLGGVTVVSCDNLQGNGGVARTAFRTFASHIDLDLARWMDEEMRFPNSMVDRITPVTTDADRRALADRFGVTDRWPVVCEPFVQWILEDEFASGRPALEAVGVQLVEDVAPYELMKLRLLNAGHQLLAYAGSLAGYRLVHEAAGDPLFSRFLAGYMRQEALPTLLPVEGIDLREYCAELLVRFANPGVGDTLSRLAANASDLIPKFVLPVVRHQLAHGGPFDRCATTVACWARYVMSVDDQGEPIALNDRNAERLRSAARSEESEPGSFLRQPEIFGELGEDERFQDAYLRALTSLRTRGVRPTLEAIA